MSWRLGRRSSLVVRMILSNAGVLFVIVGWEWFAGAQTAALKPPAPIDAIAGIAEALRSHAAVGVASGEGHGDARGPAFLISLIRDPRVTAVATDVVMEGASGRYQEAMDRYVRGETVSPQELRPIWDETTQPQVPGPIWAGDVPPIYRVVREVNALLPQDRRIRVLLADPPIEWEHVRTPADYRIWLEQRDSYPADLIRREVVAKGRRAIVYFGGGHLQRKQQLSNYQMDSPLAQTVISLIEGAGVKTFVVRTGSDRDGMSGWPYPSLAVLWGTTIGAENEPSISPQRMAVKDGKLVPISREQWISIRRDEQADALLYLGPESTRTEAAIPVGVCADANYIQVRLQRIALAGLPPPESDRLRKLCGL